MLLATQPKSTIQSGLGFRAAMSGRAEGGGEEEAACSSQVISPTNPIPQNPTSPKPMPFPCGPCPRARVARLPLR